MDIVVYLFVPGWWSVNESRINQSIHVTKRTEISVNLQLNLEAMAILYDCTTVS